MGNTQKFIELAAGRFTTDDPELQAFLDRYPGVTLDPSAVPAPVNEPIFNGGYSGGGLAPSEPILNGGYSGGGVGTAKTRSGATRA
jgi:hypothetical protein